MINALSPNKAKIAGRVIEVLEFFARENRPATVSDICAHFDRPQSSTSELLTSLVKLGVLYRDAEMRSYAPTPRMAALGMAMQPEAIAGGGLFRFMDRLAQISRCRVGLFGMVGTNVQVLRSTASLSRNPGRGRQVMACGETRPATASVAGALLLSSLRDDHTIRGLLWRLSSEVRPKDRFDLARMADYIKECGVAGHATGPSGFEPNKQMTCVLLPPGFGKRGLVMAITHETRWTIDPEAVVATLTRGLALCLKDGIDESSFITAISGPDVPDMDQPAAKISFPTSAA